MSLLPLLFLFLFLNCDDTGSAFLWTEEREIAGAMPSARFGSGADWIGDLNGDGFADLVVGAPGDGRNGVDSGAVYVHLGSSFGLSGSPGLTIVGKAGDRLGSSIAGLGDVNGDGLEDFSVSAAGCAGRGISGRGVVLIFFGEAFAVGVTRDAESADILLASDSEGEVPIPSSAGDLDQSGALDLAVGLPDANRVLVFLNGVVFPSSNWIDISQADITITGASEGDRFGASLAAVGDVNEQNFGRAGRFGDDLLIGAPKAGGTGLAYLFLGRSGRSRGAVSASAADVLYEGAEPDEGFGSSVAGLGYFDGDDVMDFAVGSPDLGAGRVSVFFGRSNAGPDPSLTPARFTGEAAGDRFGASVTGTLPSPFGAASALIVGAPGNDFTGTDQGSVYLFTRNLFASGASLNGATAEAAFADRIFRNPQAGTRGEFGTVVRMGLDVNGDGNPDLLIGSPGSDLAGEDSGMASVLW